MSANLVELAEKKKLEAEQEVQRLQADLERAKQEVAEWERFVARATSLVPVARAKQELPTVNGDAVTVQRKSLPGYTVELREAASERKVANKKK